ncbi:MAG: signal peptidase I [Candidatus Pacebacteria bacterium]|nr:signal peptidase I [Candidatus Paceibacterota bacterium]
MKKTLLFFWEIVKIFLIALLIVIPIREFIFQPFFVRGQSMEPNFHDFDYLIIDEISYRFSNPQRGDVVVFRNPNNLRQRLIKRIIGLPNETVKIKNGVVIIEKEGKSFVLKEPYLKKGTKTWGKLEIHLKENQYFVLGDNRIFSLDSRFFGPVDRSLIIGKVALRIWPLSVFAKKAPNF